MPPEAFDQIAADVTYHRLVITWLEAVERAGVLPDEVVNGQRCRALRVPLSDNAVDTAWFSIETGLPIGLERLWLDSGGLKRIMYFGEWVRRGDIQLFSKTWHANERDGPRVAFTMVEAVFNDLEAHAFAIPPAVQAIIDFEERRDRDQFFAGREVPGRDAIAAMTIEEAQRRLGEVSRERTEARGDEARESRLKREFALLMERIRELRGAGEEAGAKDPEAKPDGNH